MKNKFFIPYGRQYIDNSDIFNVKKILKNKNLTLGPLLYNFEKKLKYFFNVKNVIACSSGTAAIHLAFLSIGLKKNDIVIMPSINFIAAYNICNSMGARIIFADVDSITGQITPNTILIAIKKYKIKNIKAILTMYLGGYPENIKEFYKIKKKYNCYLIEDACHALGAFSENKKKSKIGSCKYSDISTFSLHPIKNITTGEGGIVTTNDNLIAKKTRLYRSHGLEKNSKYYWKYKLHNFGYNYRLSEINCALGLSQLNKINYFIKKRKSKVKKYIKEISSLKNYINIPNYNSLEIGAHHLFIIHLQFNRLKGNKDDFIKFLNKKNIFPQFHYTPIYRLKKFKNFNIKNFAGSEKYFKTCISIPIYVGLSKKNQNYVIKNIINYINKFKKKN